MEAHPCRPVWGQKFDATSCTKGLPLSSGLSLGALAVYQSVLRHGIYARIDNKRVKI